MAHLDLQIDGMTCGGCVAAVQNVLARQPGVTGLRVEIGHVWLDYDEKVASLDAVSKAIEKAGYHVQSLA